MIMIWKKDLKQNHEGQFRSVGVEAKRFGGNEEETLNFKTKQLREKPINH